ncbi:MAG: glucokinase [Gammaproteobacteria bacterium]|nr:glucokinase [Gammaproteobacteria bacterium]
MLQQFNLVGDLGGTNVRFGLCEKNSTRVEHIERFTLRDYEGLDHVIKVYLRDKLAGNDQVLAGCCLAIAGPIIDHSVKMTNSDWEFSADSLRQWLAIEQVALINDFEAIALSVPHLEEHDFAQIGSVASPADGPITVFGPGTGLGAALLVPNGLGGYIVVPTEGGHAGLSARSSKELEVFAYWRDKGCRINREFFVCGAGIERIYEAVCVEAGSQDYKKHTVANIQQLGCKRENKLCEQAMEMFCAFLGSAAGDQVLCTGSTGGVVLAGGILPKFVDFLNQSNFRKRFETKGVMSHYTEEVPTRLIIAAQPGLVGAAAYLLE